MNPRMDRSVPHHGGANSRGRPGPSRRAPQNGYLTLNIQVESRLRDQVTNPGRISSGQGDGVATPPGFVTREQANLQGPPNSNWFYQRQVFYGNTNGRYVPQTSQPRIHRDNAQEVYALRAPMHLYYNPETTGRVGSLDILADIAAEADPIPIDAETGVSSRPAPVLVSERVGAKEARATRIRYIRDKRQYNRNKRRGPKPIQPYRLPTGPVPTAIQKRIDNRKAVQKCRENKKVKVAELRAKLAAFEAYNKASEDLHKFINKLDLPSVWPKEMKEVESKSMRIPECTAPQTSQCISHNDVPENTLAGDHNRLEMRAAEVPGNSIRPVVSKMGGSERVTNNTETPGDVHNQGNEPSTDNVQVHKRIHLRSNPFVGS